MERDAYNLFVKHIPSDLLDIDLEKLFGQYGKIRSCKIMRNQNGESLGFGFVKFFDNSEAEKAKTALHGCKIESKLFKKALLVKTSNLKKQTKCVKLVNIPSDVKTDQIPKLFLGSTVLNVKLIKGNAYVLFKDEIEAVEVVNKSCGEITINNHKILMTYGKESTFKDEKTMNPILKVPKQEFTDKSTTGENLFVFHLPPDIDDIALLNLFSPFGKIDAVKVIVDPISKLSKGYGFVKYFHLSDAIKAVSSLNGFKIGHKSLKVSFKK
jgi:RNA recognition motif-containing protein